MVIGQGFIHNGTVPALIEGKRISGDCDGALEFREKYPPDEKMICRIMHSYLG